MKSSENIYQRCDRHSIGRHPIRASWESFSEEALSESEAGDHGYTCGAKRRHKGQHRDPGKVLYALGQAKSVLSCKNVHG